MTFDLYLSKSEKNQLEKNLEKVASYNGTLRSECSLTDPVILLEIDQESINITQCNYAFIPEFKRYYFIRSMKVIREGLWELTLHVDVLQSFAPFIKVLPAVISRSSSGSPMLQDNNIKMFADHYVYLKAFPNKFTEKEYILTLIGRQ